VATVASGEERKAVLFACTLNCIRSPMAAAILEHLGRERFLVMSAGVRAGQQDPYAVAVMDEIGIDLSEHEPQPMTIISDHLFDVIVSLSPEAHHHTLELTRTMAAEVEYWPTLDCSLALAQPKRDNILKAYRGVRDELFKRVRTRFAIEGGPTV
jgi:protein-tyrosine-phosphatase